MTPSRQPSAASSRPSTSFETRDVSKRTSLLSLFRRKRSLRLSSPEPARGPVKLNFLFVGGRCSGQTSLLFRTQYGYFPDTRGFARPLYESYTNTRSFNGVSTRIELWDTSGVSDLNMVQLLSYMNWDAVFLCFDISDKVSMYTIVQWWQHASQHGFALSDSLELQVYLLGMKKDLRDQCFVEDHREGAALTPSGLMAYSTCCVCASEARWHAKRIGACGYLECSASSGEGLEELFNSTVWEAIRRLGIEDSEEEVPKKKKARFL